MTPPAADPDFALTSAARVARLAEQIRAIRALPFVQHQQPYWPERFFIFLNSFKTF
jgi:hypothetical protein